MAKPHGNQKVFAAAFDNGFGNGKLLIEGHETIIFPSYRTEKYMEDVPGRVLFDGRSFTVGESAFRGDDFFIRNVDDPSSKINDALIMLLGGIAHLPPRKQWDLKLAISIHDADNFKDELTQKLSGTHECVLRGSDSKVNIEVIKVVPEGTASLFGEKVPNRLTLLDFGNGTTLLSRYADNKRESHEPEPCGVEQLIDLISVKMKAVNNGLPGKRSWIRQGLESGKLNYGRSQSIADIYKVALQEWFNEYLRKPVSKAKNAYELGDEVWCIGGGCLLKGMRGSLTKLGFKIHEHPLEANVRGLLRIAQKYNRKTAVAK